MTRIRGVTVPPAEVAVWLDLLIDPTSEWTEEELELAWEAYGPEIMANGKGHGLPGTRPWAYWHFDLGEDYPQRDDAAIRLAELGLLRDEELAAIAEKASEAKARIGTTREHHDGQGHSADRDAVALHEAVTRALR